MYCGTNSSNKTKLNKSQYDIKTRLKQFGLLRDNQFGCIGKNDPTEGGSALYSIIYMTFTNLRIMVL